uniref:Pallidipin-like salivary lipocalin n=1 Tax=Triatoma infestans TaxID=30076 RepID=A6YPP8_TRIIF|nr:pallidipin-like salivary lipocalin [Triatoma infestans]
MKTIIAVTFFGILTYAFGEHTNEIDETYEDINHESHLSSHSCSCKYKPMTNFNLTAYLQMTQTHRTYSKYKSLTVCRVLNTERKACGSVEVNIYGYYQYSGGIHYSEIICNTTENNMKKGQFWADCKIVVDTYPDDLHTEMSNHLEPDDLQTLTSYDLTKFKLYMSVIDTDYKNYAIIYNCMIDELGAQDNMAIAQTNIFGCEDPIKGALKKKGENLEKFFITNATYCLSHGRQVTTEKQDETNEIQAKK